MWLHGLAGHNSSIALFIIGGTDPNPRAIVRPESDSAATVNPVPAVVVLGALAGLLVTAGATFYWNPDPVLGSAHCGRCR